MLFLRLFDGVNGLDDVREGCFDDVEGVNGLDDVRGGCFDDVDGVNGLDVLPC